MLQLAAVYSTYLQELLNQKKISLDAVELTPWQPVSLLPKIMPGLAGYRLYFHGSNLTARTLFLPGERSHLADTLRLTRASWFSTHISLLPPGWGWLALRFDIHLPIPPLERMLSGYIRDVKRLKAEYNHIPLLLENMPVEPRRVYKQMKSPKLISEVIEKTDCGLLLDLPHARIAAEAFGMEAIDYLQQLPLNRVVEIHTSGPKRRPDGILMDQHSVMQAEDYDLLQWALAHTPVKLVTLEYFKDRNGLEEQLLELSHRIGIKENRR